MEVTPLFPAKSTQIDSNTTLQQPPQTIKFSFLAKILNSSLPKSSIDSFLVRQGKFSRLSNRNEQERNSAKGILKKTIISQSNNKFGESTRQNFLMKGKMLNGSKKPIQNHMNSFLLCINERINRQIERTQNNTELPALTKHDLQTTSSSPAKKYNYKQIFKNLKDVREKKIDESIQLPKTYSKYREKSSQQQRKDPSQTISYDLEASRHLKQFKQMNQVRSSKLQQLPAFRSNHLLHMKRQNSYKRGYLVYDQSALQFHDSFRSNMQKNYKQNSIKTKQLTANAYFVIDCVNLTPLSGRNVNQSIQIASISKVMTCYLCIMICKKYDIDIYNYQVRVGDKAAETPGTTAELQTGDILTIYQLLLGLMLPSGNDASVVIAQALGKIIKRNKKKQTKKTYYETFIAHMNLLSKELQLNQTWNNSSGLSFSPNYSTPQSIAILTAIAVRNPLFHRIVNTKVYEIDIKNQRYGLNRKLIWKNTNKLLDNGWQGVKTGTTESAGHCLIAKKDNYLICVFDCETLSRRFIQCQKLYQMHSSPSSLL